jgi:hypothetical protein
MTDIVLEGGPSISSVASGRFERTALPTATSTRSGNSSGAQQQQQPLQKSWNTIREYTKEVVNESWMFGKPEQYFSL